MKKEEKVFVKAMLMACQTSASLSLFVFCLNKAYQHVVCPKVYLTPDGLASLLP